MCRCLSRLKGGQLRALTTADALDQLRSWKISYDGGAMEREILIG